MDIAITLLKMVGGLILLLYGMGLLSANLKKLAGKKFEAVLSKATNNVFKGLFTGILITIAVQSSAATTVMVVGFVNAGILKFRNAIPIIMGANIGTTITSQILRLASVSESSIFSLFSPACLAPILLIIGFVLPEIHKKQKTKDFGNLLIGIGLLFTGLMTMIDMASSFSDSPIFITVLSQLSNPILGLLAGAVLTIMLQSSAAAVGILQALSITGYTTYAAVIPIILGQNIGTCFTSILSSIGTSKNAKRTAAVHLYFNLIGAIAFMIVIYVYQYLIGFPFWNNPMNMGDIANFHLIFNVITTLLLLPCIGILEKLALFTIRENPSEKAEEYDTYLASLNKLDARIAQIPRIAITNTLDVVSNIGELTLKSFRKSLKLIDGFDSKIADEIHEIEDIIDKMDVEVTKFLVNLNTAELTDRENTKVANLLKISSEFEKISDYTFSFSKISESLYEQDLKMSQVADKELKIVYNITENSIVKTLESLKLRNPENIIDIEALRQLAEQYKEKYKLDHVERLKNGKCSVETGIFFVEVLTTFEKIVDKCVNISVSAVNISSHTGYVTKHEYIHLLHDKDVEALELKKQEFNERYAWLEVDNKLE